MRRLNQREASMLGLLLGGLIRFWLFALAFTRSTADLRRDAILPLLVTTIAATILGALAPTSWARTAICIALPTIALEVLFITPIIAAGRGAGWTYLLVIVSVVGTAFGGAFVGNRLRSG